MWCNGWDCVCCTRNSNHVTLIGSQNMVQCELWLKWLEWMLWVMATVKCWANFGKGSKCVEVAVHLSEHGNSRCHRITPSRPTLDFQKVSALMQVAGLAELQNEPGDTWRSNSLVFQADVIEFLTCLPPQRLSVCLGPHPDRQGCEPHRHPGLELSSFFVNDNTMFKEYEYKPMARAPDSPAILTRPEVGAISESGEPVMELLVWVEAETWGKLDWTRQSGHTGLRSL